MPFQAFRKYLEVRQKVGGLRDTTEINLFSELREQLFH